MENRWKNHEGKMVEERVPVDPREPWIPRRPPTFINAHQGKFCVGTKSVGFQGVALTFLYPLTSLLSYTYIYLDFCSMFSTLKNWLYTRCTYLRCAHIYLLSLNPVMIMNAEQHKLRWSRTSKDHPWRRSPRADMQREKYAFSSWISGCESVSKITIQTHEV